MKLSHYPGTMPMEMACRMLLSGFCAPTLIQRSALLRFSARTPYPVRKTCGTFSTAPGETYHLEESEDLVEWRPVRDIEGGSFPTTNDLPRSPGGNNAT
ncbi:MAG: hypothetical protein ACI9R3_004219 [Verrucomicrobiales bacterium]|jgi:hypothetical protein